MNIVISINSDGTLNVNHEESNPKRSEKGKSIIALPSTYCMLDLETTGFCPDWDEIIEIAAIKYQEGEEIERFQSLVQPFDDGSGKFVSGFVTELTGITNEMLADAPSAPEVISRFVDFLGDSLIVGYNVSFDVNFLYDACMTYLNRPLSNDFIDCMRMARRLHPEMEHHRLQDVTEKYGIVKLRAHRAMNDVEATQACYLILAQEAIERYGSEEAFAKTFKSKGGNKGLAKQIVKFDDIKTNPENPLFRKVCVFTGKLEKFERRDAMQIVANIGGINADSVTKKTNYLILGNNDYCTTIKDGKSSKQKKAEQYKLDGYDIEIIPENVFYEMLGDLIG